MKRYKYLCFLLFLSIGLSAQVNLVPNGNFDDSVRCSPTKSAIANWFVPINEVINPDNPCAYLAWWRFLSYPKAGLNKTACGFIETYYRGFPDDNIYSGRGYLAIKLRETLTAGERYYFEFYTRAVDTFPSAQLVNTVFTNGQEVAFTKIFPTFNIDVSRTFLNLPAKEPSKLYDD